MSSAGKEILIKSVAQAIPLYTMQTFLLPKTFCDELNQLVAQFWWGSEAGKRRIHWMKWQTLCKPKSEGGLGFKDLYAFNLALLAKQGWRLIQFPNSLVARIFKAKYYPSTDFMQAHVSSNSSYCWRSVAASRMIIQRGARWRVGDGLSIRIWGDSWLPRENLFKVLSPIPARVHPSFTVRSLMVDNSGLRWNSSLLQSWFMEEEVRLILGIPLSMFSPVDSMIWTKESKGEFTTKSAYFVARTCHGLGGEVPAGSTLNADTKFLWKALWLAKVPGKVKICVWRGCMNALPSKVNLKIRRVLPEDICGFCNKEAENS